MAVSSPTTGKTLPSAIAVLLATLALATVLDLVPPLSALVETSLQIWFLSIFSLAAVVFALANRTGAPRFGIVAATFLLGGAAQLWLTEPLWFPALRLRPSGIADLVMIGVIGLQAGVALRTLRSCPPGKVLPLVSAAFGTGRVVLWIALSAAFSVSLMGFLNPFNATGYGARIIAGGGLLGVNLLSLSALVWNPPPQVRLSRPALTPLLLAAVAVLGSAVLAWFGFERIGHVEDEVAYLFQARTFASGNLHVPAPPEAARQALEYYLMEFRGDRWISVTSPGWPAVLALGVLAGAPWLVNPVLAGVAVLLSHGIARPVVGRARADLICLLLATSPWLLAVSATLMTHSLGLVLLLASWWLLVRLSGSTPAKAAWLALAAGLLMGWLFTTRPLEGVLFGVLGGVWMLWRLDLRQYWPAVMAFGLGCLATGLVLFAYNWAITGDPLVAPIAEYIDRTWSSGANAFGFGAGIGPSGGWGRLDIFPGHSPIEGAINTLHNISGLDLELFGWSTGSLLLIWAFLLWKRPDGFDRAMMIVAGSTIAVHFFYWFSGGFYVGPRYWYGAIVAFAALSASGVIVIVARLETAGVSDAGVRAGWVLSLLCLFGLLVFTSWRGVAKYHDYGNYSTEIWRDAEAGVFGNALVIVGPGRDFGSASILNDPMLPSDKPIFIRDLGVDANAATAAAFPGREVMKFVYGSE